MDHHSELHAADAKKGQDAHRQAVPGGSAAHRILGLQRAVGNQAVLDLLDAQAKLDVDQVNDPCEQEADAVACRVTGLLASRQAGGLGSGIRRPHRRCRRRGRGADDHPAARQAPWCGRRGRNARR